MPLSVDLADWVRASGRTLGTLLADLDRLGNFEDPDLEFGTGDLATSLPAGPILLRGRLRTALSQEDVERRLRLPIRKSAIRAADRCDREPRRGAAAAGSPAGIRAGGSRRPRPRLPGRSRRNTIRRLRCGSTSNCSTG